MLTRTRRMQRWTAIVFAALTAVFIGAVFLARAGGPRTAAGGPGLAADAGADAARDASPASPAATDAGELPELLEDPQLAGSTNDAGSTLLSGEVPPGLAQDAPKSVVFGVILVQYKGAQGAPPNAKSREAALELAQQLAKDAKQDFKATAAKAKQLPEVVVEENAGRMPRGMLERAPEYVLFSLPKDGVSDPVDTPRGFWIARRIE